MTNTQAPMSPSKLLLNQPGTASEAVVRAVCACVSEGGVVALPTDTLYGVAASLGCAHRLFQLKSRDPVKPVAICVADVLDVYSYARVTVPASVLGALLPGPYTVVFERADRLPSCVNPNTRLVGVRVPEHPLTRAVCRRLQAPLALTSANRSAQPSALCTQDFCELWPHVDLIVDEGALAGDRSGSTVLDLSVHGQYSVIRDGCADLKLLDRLLTSHGITRC